MARPRLLIRPCLLLVLAEAPGHGYALIDRLKGLGFDWDGPGPIYQHLRNLQDASLLQSSIATRSGPARRIYELTDSGKAALDVSAGGVGHLSWLTGEFLRRHRRMTGLGAKP